jgi:hypothetical protein
VLLTQGIGGGKAVWQYQSTDAASAVDDANYFSNGKDLGMKVGDVVLVIDTDNTAAQTTHSVTAVTASGATVSAAT